MPKVSVVMSVYNGAPYLREAMDSILNQTFTDFEFIVIDDGSTDNTCAILADYDDSRIYLKHNARNIGLTRSLNKGVSIAQGEYIARQDADDVSLPHRLARQLKFMQNHPGFSGIGSWAELIDCQDKSTQIARRPTDHEEIYAHLLIHNPFIHTSAFIRKQRLEQVGKYRDDLTYAQDYDLWWRLAQVGRLHMIPEVLVKRRKRTPGGIGDQHLQDQISLVYQIACRIVQKQVGLKEAELLAFQHLFWTLQGYPERWQRGDTRMLRPLWNYFALRPAYRRVGGALVTKIACRIVSYEAREGVKLARVASHDLGWPNVWPEFLKTWGKLCAPALIGKIYRSLKHMTVEN